MYKVKKVTDPQEFGGTKKPCDLGEVLNEDYLREEMSWNGMSHCELLAPCEPSGYAMMPCQEWKTHHRSTSAHSCLCVSLISPKAYLDKAITRKIQ